MNLLPPNPEQFETMEVEYQWPLWFKVILAVSVGLTVFMGVTVTLWVWIICKMMN